MFDGHVIRLKQPNTSTSGVARDVVCDPHVMISFADCDCRAAAKGMGFEAGELDITTSDYNCIGRSLDQRRALAHNDYRLLGSPGFRHPQGFSVAPTGD